MKTIIFFIAVTFGAVDISADIYDKLDACYELAYYNDGVCPNYDAQIACFDKIDPADDMEKTELQDTIDFAKKEKNVCPGLNTPEKCVFSETEKCLNEYYDKEYEKTKEVCNEVPIARDCLIKLNSTCTDDVVSFDVEELDNITALCEAGHYDDGPCSASMVRNCSLDLFSDFKDFDDEDVESYEFSYECDTETVVETKRCLAGLRKTCKSPAIQNEIDFEWDFVNEACPPS